ncbi:cytochrome p450 domain-containing protein [Phthorimaea operculella]|nr:cytochrome p450 domain-containing protein [Phthorimaea operculella]
MATPPEKGKPMSSGGLLWQKSASEVHLVGAFFFERPAAAHVVVKYLYFWDTGRNILDSTMPATTLSDVPVNHTLTSLIFYPLVIFASGLWLFHRWQQKSRLYVLGNKIPGPMALPIFGNALMAIGKRPDQLVELGLQYAEKYGNVIRGWLGTKLVIFLTDADDVEVILNSHVHIDKSSDYRFFKPWLGEGLLISSGEKWRSHRKMIAPTFHINILKSFMGVFNQNSRNVVEKMRPEMGKTFDVHDYMSGVTTVVALTFMGVFNQNSRNVVEKMRPEMGKTFDVHDYMSGVTVDILLVLKSFMGVFNQNSRNVVEKMRPEMGKTFDVHDYMSGVTVDILLVVVLKHFMSVFNQNSTNVVEKMRPEMGKTI